MSAHGQVATFIVVLLQELEKHDVHLDRDICSVGIRRQGPGLCVEVRATAGATRRGWSRSVVPQSAAEDARELGREIATELHQGAELLKQVKGSKLEDRDRQIAVLSYPATWLLSADLSDRMRQALEDRDRRIAELETEVADLRNELAHAKTDMSDRERESERLRAQLSELTRGAQ